VRRTRRIPTVIAVTALAPWLVWAVVRLLGLDVAHPLIALMAFTPYVAASSPVPLVIAVLLRRRAAAAVAAVVAVALAAVVLPRAVPGPQHAGPDARGPRLVVMTANLRIGNGDADTVLRLAAEHRVDVLSLQELTRPALARLDAAGVRKAFPGRAVIPHPGGAGTGLMARRPLRRIAFTDPPGPAQPEAALDVPGAVPIRIKAVHPLPPISSDSAASWERHLRALPAPRTDATLRILAGDFNGTLDQREFRRLLGRGYTDAADATGDGLHATWPVGRRRPLITIDHVLVPPGVRVRQVTVEPVPGSDHRAVIAELVLPRG
jgi:endonuclease/exonuclease/phosphatase (EEP) superfamily protein YafD